LSVRRELSIASWELVTENVYVYSKRTLKQVSFKTAFKRLNRFTITDRSRYRVLQADSSGRMFKRMTVTVAY